MDEASPDYRGDLRNRLQLWRAQEVWEAGCDMAARMARAPVPSADLQRQLATLLGKEAQDIGNIRKTDEIPPRISVIDVAALIANKDKNQAAEDFRRLTVRYPDVKANCFDVHFRDSRGWQDQKETPVMDRGCGADYA